MKSMSPRNIGRHTREYVAILARTSATDIQVCELLLEVILRRS